MSHDCGEAKAELSVAQQKGNQKDHKAPYECPLYVWRCTYVRMYVERMTCRYGHKPYGQPCSVWLRIYGFEIAPFCSNPVRCQVLGNAQKNVFIDWATKCRMIFINLIFANDILHTFLYGISRFFVYKRNTVVHFFFIRTQFIGTQGPYFKHIIINLSLVKALPKKGCANKKSVRTNLLLCHTKIVWTSVIIVQILKIKKNCKKLVQTYTHSFL